MAEISKAALENAIRNEILEAIAGLMKEKYDLGDESILYSSSSEFSIPVVDAEGNEKFALIKVSIPRGTRKNGGYEPYDGYAAAEDYRLDCADKQAKKEASAAKKAQAEQEKERKRAMRTKKMTEGELKAKLREIAENITEE